MPDQNAARDENKVPTLLAVTSLGERRRVVVNDDGSLSSDPTSQAALLDIERGITDYEVRIDYADRTDDQPVYIARAPQGTPTSSPIWKVEKIDYDGSNRAVRKQIATGAYDDRATLF